MKMFANKKKNEKNYIMVTVHIITIYIYIYKYMYLGILWQAWSSEGVGGGPGKKHYITLEWPLILILLNSDTCPMQPTSTDLC